MNRRTSPPSLARQIKRPQRGLTEGAEAFEASENHRKERDRLYRLQKNSIQGKVLKGHDFSRANKANQFCWALAPEGCFFGISKSPQASFRSLFSRRPFVELAGRPGPASRSISG